MKAFKAGELDGRPRHQRKAVKGGYSARERHLWSRYRWTLADFDARLAAQGGRCLICGTTEPEGNGWHVDHDHAHCGPNKGCEVCIRGILCSPCNTDIGTIEKNRSRLSQMLGYLDFHQRRIERAK